MCQVQLQHVKSKRFLSLDPKRAPVKDDCLCINLQTIGSGRSGVTIHPRFRIKTDGEKIDSGSQIKITFRHKRETLSAARSSSPALQRAHGSAAAVLAASQQHEFADSHHSESNSALKMHLYARYDANAAKLNYLKANDGAPQTCRILSIAFLCFIFVSCSALP